MFSDIIHAWATHIHSSIAQHVVPQLTCGELKSADAAVTTEIGKDVQGPNGDSLSSADETEAIQAANAGLQRIKGDMEYDAAEVAAATAAVGALIIISTA
mmetsp:Transcript_81167/g.118842  ORF Transcript_81167/g.118842 Transcript_81167/m.118842 type:complete len:100 (+) Transcript_81167:49-348(+)